MNFQILTGFIAMKSSAWMYRFISVCKRRRSYKGITVEELNTVEKIWYQQVQYDCYNKKINNLLGDIRLKKNSKLNMVYSYLAESDIQMKRRAESF